MPEISRFFGIVVAMYYGDHAPPHFHATYGSDKAQIRIDPPGLLRGTLPPRALAMVVEWASMHQAELMASWFEASQDRVPGKIEPLR